MSMTGSRPPKGIARPAAARSPSDRGSHIRGCSAGQLQVLTGLLDGAELIDPHGPGLERSLKAYTTLKSAAIRRHLNALARDDHVTKKVMRAGRTPIGGGWPTHTRWAITAAGRVMAEAELARYELSPDHDAAVVEDLRAALRGERIPSILREEGAAAAEAERNGREREAARRVREARLLEAIGVVERGGAPSSELADIVKEYQAGDPGPYVPDQLRQLFPEAAPRLFTLVAGRARGIGWVLAVNELPDYCGLSAVADQRYAEVVDAMKRDPEWLTNHIHVDVVALARAALLTTSPKTWLQRLHEVVTSWGEPGSPVETVYEGWLGGHDYALRGWAGSYALAVLKTDGVEAALEFIRENPDRLSMGEPEAAQIARAAARQESLWTSFCNTLAGVLSHGQDVSREVGAMAEAVGGDDPSRLAALMDAASCRGFWWTEILFELLRRNLVLPEQAAVRVLAQLQRPGPVLPDERWRAGLPSADRVDAAGWALATHLVLGGNLSHARSLVEKLNDAWRVANASHRASVDPSRTKALALAPQLLPWSS